MESRAPGTTGSARLAGGSRRRGRRRWPGRVARAAGILLVFALGLVLGDALGDRPGDPQRVTEVQRVRQVSVRVTVAARTTTVVVTATPTSSTVR